MSKFSYYRCDNCGREMGMPAHLSLMSGQYKASVSFKITHDSPPAELCRACMEKLFLEAERHLLEGTYITIGAEKPQGEDYAQKEVRVFCHCGAIYLASTTGRVPIPEGALHLKCPQCGRFGNEAIKIQGHSAGNFNVEWKLNVP